jgi:hypothetical protein
LLGGRLGAAAVVGLGAGGWCFASACDCAVFLSSAVFLGCAFFLLRCVVLGMALRII